MFNVTWIHVKYIFIVLQNTLVYVKCIGTPQKVTKLQPNLWLNEHKSYFWMKNLKKLINMEGYTI
jgi:hypothetical protein